MTDEQIVEAAKSAEKKTEFGELVHSKVSRGVNSAYGIGFLEGAEWAREQMSLPEKQSKLRNREAWITRAKKELEDKK